MLQNDSIPGFKDNNNKALFNAVLESKKILNLWKNCKNFKFQLMYVFIISYLSV